MTKTLTDKQQKFLEVLFDEAQGDFVLAKQLAGYSDATPTRGIVIALEEEIFDATRKYIVQLGPRAAAAFGNILVDPTQLGAKERMAAAGQVLDRAGVVKTERIQVEAAGGLFILPPKDRSADDED
jgi:hypothetical protein